MSFVSMLMTEKTEDMLVGKAEIPNPGPEGLKDHSCDSVESVVTKFVCPCLKQNSYNLYKTTQN